jgi:ribosome-associated heat shock protein Hsp15
MESENNEHIRIDKWLWAVRIFKTRNMAANACKKSKVLLNGRNVKPSHSVKIGDVIEVRHSIITRTFNVNGLLEKRVSAKIAIDYVEETTPPEEFKKLRVIKDMPFALREKGAGRPTKKDRRQIRRLKKEI